MKRIAKYEGPGLTRGETRRIREIADDGAGALYWRDGAQSMDELGSVDWVDFGDWDYAGAGATVESLRPSPEHRLVERDGEIILTPDESARGAAYRRAGRAE